MVAFCGPLRRFYFLFWQAAESALRRRHLFPYELYLPKRFAQNFELDANTDLML